MKNVRISTTNDEKLAQEAAGLEGTMFNMQEHDINKLIQDEKAKQFNNEVDSFLNEFKEHTEVVEKLQEGVNPENIEIKPMHDHVLVKPFKHNPFQKLEIKNGIITDTGGYHANVEKNPITGKYEEQDQVIFTGVVVETGYETKILKEGDVVFYHKRDALPIPFFKQGLWDIPEYRVLAVVNENLTERFDEWKQKK